MPWKRNRSSLAQTYRDLTFLPSGRSAWDCTLSCLAYGVRMDTPDASPDLNAWAARHGLPASQSYAELGDSALVLWHGSSRERAEKMVQHGLFHKKGLWTARHPSIPHAFCRMRSERFGTEGAVVCLVLDRNSTLEGHDYEATNDGNVLRFHHFLPSEAVEYVLLRNEIRFTGSRRAAAPQPWRPARFKHSSGTWVPVQRPPVRFSDTESFSRLDQFLKLAVLRLFAELSCLAPLEAFSVLYSLVYPWECLTHTAVMDLLHSVTSRTRRVGKWELFEAGDGIETRS